MASAGHGNPSGEEGMLFFLMRNVLPLTFNELFEKKQEGSSKGGDFGGINNQNVWFCTILNPI